MTKKLEEEFNLPPIQNIDEMDFDPEETQVSEEDLKQEIQQYQGELTAAQKADAALPIVSGLEELDREMDDYAKRAMETFEDLVDLGHNVEDRHAAPIFDSASKMLQAALTAKTAKMDKKLKMVELQMRQARLDLETRKVDASVGKDDDVDVAEGKIIGDRSSMIAEIMNKMKDTDK